jgi:tetratricopeptide (TPR) repeat protein
MSHPQPTTETSRLNGPSEPAAAASGPGSALRWMDRRFLPVLLALCLLSLPFRAAILYQYVTGNPLSGMPISDAAVFWNFSERLAGDQALSKLPFTFAPLYPYMVGLVRMLGGGLTAVYVLQMLMDIATAVVLAFAARRRFGGGAGLLSAALFLLLMEPASFSLRILNCSLQLLLVALTYARLLRAQEKPSAGNLVAAGIPIGLLSLAYPPAMMLAFVIPVWLFFQSRHRMVDALRSLVPLALTALVISPATIHNYVITKEIIPIQGGASVGLLHGNQPRSDGGYAALPGISDDRETMIYEVGAQYCRATGTQFKDIRYKDVSRFYRNKVLDFWRSNPKFTALLTAKKLWYFLTGRNYSDIYQPTAEIDFGVTTFLRFVPLQVPWLMGPALLGLILMLRRPIRHGPELLLFGLPLAIVMTFFYSPRYRLPAVPIIVVAAAWSFVQAADFPRRKAFPIAVALSLAAAVGVGFVNQAVGFDRYNRAVMAFTLADAYGSRGDSERAVQYYREGLQYPGGRDNVGAMKKLGNTLVRLGRPTEAFAAFERAMKVSPDDPAVTAQVAMMLLKAQRVDEAEQMLTQALKTRPDDPMLLAGMAVTKQLQLKTDEALALFGQSLKLQPENTQVRVFYADLLRLLDRTDEAIRQFEEVLKSDPENFQAHFSLGFLWSERRNVAEARSHFEHALRLQPLNADVIYGLGVLDLNERRLDDAERRLQHALGIDPDHEPSRKALERVRELKGAAPGPRR